MKKNTLSANLGREHHANPRVVNIPPYRASTVLFSDMQAMKDEISKEDGFYYGRTGSPTVRALEEAVCKLEGGFKSIAATSGLAAITTTLTALTKSGDEILVVDTAYSPTRGFCDKILAKFGVKTIYYAPRIGEKIEDLITDKTALIFAESPGSLTFEMQDIPAIAKVTNAKKIPLVIDNTWASPVFFKPFSYGVNVSINAGTKYIVGHSDAMLGVITADEKYYKPIKKTAFELGEIAGSEEAWLGLRGIRTLPLRLEKHHQNGLAVAKWLEQRPEIKRVVHPALPSNPDYAIWQRDYLGASGLFAAVFNDSFDLEKVNKFLDKLTLFGKGFSWGGFESLAIPLLGFTRTATKFNDKETWVRFHIGLEDVEDLIADLEQAFK